MGLYDQLLIVQRYAAAFVRTVVIPCIARPENWEHCRRLDRWLLPSVQDLIDFYKVKPYANEKAILNAADH